MISKSSASATFLKNLKLDVEMLGFLLLCFAPGRVAEWTVWYLLSFHTVGGAAAWGSCHTAGSGSLHSAAGLRRRRPASVSAWSHPPASRGERGSDDLRSEMCHWTSKQTRVRACVRACGHVYLRRHFTFEMTGRNWEEEEVCVDCPREQRSDLISIHVHNILSMFRGYIDIVWQSRKLMDILWGDITKFRFPQPVCVFTGKVEWATEVAVGLFSSFGELAGRLTVNALAHRATGDVNPST